MKLNAQLSNQLFFLVSSRNCGEMMRTQGTGMEVAGPCDGNSRVVYAWAMDAPALELPEGVGFKVGAGSDINYLVLQVHYATIDPFKGTLKRGHV